MKKTTFIFLFGILLSAFSITSCDKLEDAVEVTINTEFVAPLEATPIAGKSATFNESIVLDPSKSDDLSDYLDEISSVEILNIKIEVTSVDPIGIELENSTFTVVDNENGNAFVYSTPDNTKLAVGTIFEVGEDHEDWEVIQKIINDMHASTITAVGSVNDDQFKIGFNFIIKVRVTASGL